MNRNFIAGSALAVSILYALPLQVSASTVDDLMSLPLEELLQIPVTVASLLDSDELHSPSNTSTVLAEDWQRYGARRTLDAIDHLPATLVLPYSNGSDVIAIRGYAQPTSARGIATTLDGIRLNNFLFGTAQYDIPNINLGILDRIEMIRGPASALYGTDAFHGVLSLYAFESDKDMTQAGITAADNGYYQLAARYSDSLTDSVRMNLAAAGSGEADQEVRYEYADPFSGDPLFIDKEQRYQSNTLSLKLASDPSADVAWKWGIYADQYNADDFPLITADYETNLDTANYMTRLAVTKRLHQQASLEASAFYRVSDIERENRAGATAFSPCSRLDARELYYGFALTMRQPRAGSDTTQWALALSYDVAEVDKATTYLQTAPDDPFDPVGEDRTREITGLIMEASTELDRWTLIYGGRVDHYSDFGVQASPRLGVIFQPTNDSAIKLLYGRAFRAPTAGELYFELQNGVGTLGNPNLDPEIMDSLELVLLKQGKNWKANLALFENRWQDTISYKPVSATVASYENTGTSKAQGVEAALAWLPRPWRIEANASYTESRNEMTDQDFTLFPRVIINLGVGYAWDAYDTEVMLINRSFSKVDESYFSTENLPIYSRTDLTVSHDFNQELQGFLNMINVFDRDNYLPSVLGVDNGIPDQAFTISVGFRYGY